MSIWTWHGMGSGGDAKTADLYAASEIEARSLLQQMGIRVISLSPKGAPPEKMGPIAMPKKEEAPQPAPSEAQKRVASTIDAMARHVERENKIADSPSLEKQKVFYGPLDKTTEEVNKILAGGGKVVHMAVHPNMTGQMQIVVVVSSPA